MRFRVRLNNKTVASVDGSDKEAESMAFHYASQYRADGEVTIQYHTGTYWKRFALLIQWPIPEGQV